MKKKILILTTGNCGGSGKMTSIMENYFSEKNYETVTLVAFYDRGIFPIKGKKINIGTFGKKSFPGRGYLMLLLHIINTIRYINKEKPDYVIGVSCYCNFLGLCAKRFLDFKLLLTQHEYLTTRMKNVKKYQVDGLVLYAIKKLIGKTKIVCVSEAVQKDIIQYYGLYEKQTQTIYNGLDFSQIKKLGDEKIDFNEKFLINIGRLDRGKNQELLVKAYSKSKIKNDYKLLLLGEGDKDRYLRKLCKNLNVDKLVIFAGFEKNPYKFLKKASLFCFTSLTESFGLVLLESLVLDIPIITVPVTGAGEILNNGKFGIIIKDWDEQNLIKELDVFAENGVRYNYNVEEKNKFLDENFSVSVMGEKYIEALKNL